MEGERSGFEDLDCYKLALKVLQEAYRVAKQLPPEERYNLADQMRRAATSVVLNIAEGYGRYHYLDSLRFYYIARGSLSEVLSGFLACQQVGYAASQLSDQRKLCYNALRALNGYIRYVQKQRQGSREYGDSLTVQEPSPTYILTFPDEQPPLDPEPPTSYSTTSYSTTS